MFFTQDFKIGLSMLDKSNTLSNKGLLAILEDAAEMHSASVGYGVTDIDRTDLSWALLNWKVKILSRPKHGEVLTVKTWSREGNKLHFYRDFEVYNSQGDLVIIATSKWVLIDRFKHKIVKLSDDIEKEYQPENKTVFEDEDSIMLPKLKELDNYSESLKYKIRKADIDINEHVNNLCYLDIAKEILPDTINGTNEGTEFEIMYRYQIKLNDDITVFHAVCDGFNYVVVKSTDGECLHSIMKFK